MKGKAEGGDSGEGAHTRRRHAAGASSPRGLEAKVEGGGREERRDEEKRKKETRNKKRKEGKGEGEGCRDTRAQGVCTRIIAASFCAFCFVFALFFVLFPRDTTSVTRLQI